MLKSGSFESKDSTKLILMLVIAVLCLIFLTRVEIAFFFDGSNVHQLVRRATLDYGDLSF